MKQKKIAAEIRIDNAMPGLHIMRGELWTLDNALNYGKDPQDYRGLIGQVNVVRKVLESIAGHVDAVIEELARRGGMA